MRGGGGAAERTQDHDVGKTMVEGRLSFCVDGEAGRSSAGSLTNLRWLRAMPCMARRRRTWRRRSSGGGVEAGWDLHTEEEDERRGRVRERRSSLRSYRLSGRFAILQRARRFEEPDAVHVWGGEGRGCACVRRRGRRKGRRWGSFEIYKRTRDVTRYQPTDGTLLLY